jgi:hypothetical protein
VETASNAESAVQLDDFIGYFSAQSLINLSGPRCGAGQGLNAVLLFTNLSTDFVG